MRERVQAFKKVIAYISLFFFVIIYKICPARCNERARTLQLRLSLFRHARTLSTCGIEPLQWAGQIL